MPPKIGPMSDAKELIVLITAFAVITLSSFTSAGMLACTADWYAPAIPYRSIRVMVSKTIRLLSLFNRKKVRMTTAVKKSNPTMMFLLFTRSATIPPMRDSK